MIQGFRNSMTALHTWCGLFLGWLLYAIFITGTASYYRPEITQWMQPELRPQVVDPATLLARSIEEIRRQAPDATTIYVRFPNDRDPGLQLNWETPDGKRTAKVVDGKTARIEARDSRGGEFFYRFHFQLQLPYPWGRYLACLAAAFMLVALVTGIVAHRRFFKDFFTFRPSKPGTRSWLDFHNLSGVIALPFYFMIAFSAQVVFIETFMPWGRIASEPSASARQAEQAKPVTPTAQEAERPATIPPLPVAAMSRIYTEEYGSRPLGYLYASGLGTEAARVSVGPGPGAGIAQDVGGTLNFNALTGERLAEETLPRGIFGRIHDVLYGLHMIRFAGPMLRVSFFILGLLGSILVATGLVMWTVKRRKRKNHGLVERLNIATIAGLPLALATFFWANRLLPVDLPDRGDHEVAVVFWVWGATFVHACLRPVFRAWREQLWGAAALFALLPFLDVVTTPGYQTRLTFNLTLLGFGGVWAWAALRVGARIRSGQTDISNPLNPSHKTTGPE